MSDEEDQQDFRNQDSDGLGQEVDPDEEMDVVSSPKHKSTREVEGDPEAVDEEEGDDEEHEDEDEDEDEDEEDESLGRKERKRAKVY